VEPTLTTRGWGTLPLRLDWDASFVAQGELKRAATIETIEERGTA